MTIRNSNRSRIDRRPLILAAVAAAFAICLGAQFTPAGFSRLLAPNVNAEMQSRIATTSDGGPDGSGKAMFSNTPALGTVPIVNTIAGNGRLGFSGDGGDARLAQLRGSSGIAVAPDGTIYFADKDNHRIRKIDTAGVISTIAGTGVADDTGDGGLAINATLSLLLAISLDPATNNLYLSDVNNNRIRRIDLNAGTIHAFAGSGTIGFQGDGGNALFARLRRPQGVSVAPDGSVVIADTANCRIRRVSGGIITTIAGSGVCDSTGDGGSATVAGFDTPRRVYVDDSGHIFVVDNNDTDTGDNNTIRRIDEFSGVINRVAGGGATTPGSGPATAMNIGNVSDLVLDALGNLYIGSLARVYRVDLTSGILSPFAGTGAFDFSGDGGPAVDAEFNFIFGLAFRGEALVISDSANNRLRAVTGANTGGGSHVVTTTNDSGTGSLRDAMLFIQNDLPPDINTVTFNIPANDPRHFYYQNNGVPGTVSRSMIAVTAAPDDAQIADIDPDWPHSWFSIPVLSNLPLMFDNFIFMDGNSQPGTVQNTNAAGGLNSVLKIEITGNSSAVSFTNVFEAAVYRGLIVNGFEQSAGFNLDVSVGSVAAGCYIGTDPSGTIAVGNATGIYHGGRAFTIGGNSPADRNLISGNRREGMTIWENTRDSLIKGNLIGTARDGVRALPNGIFSAGNPSPGIRMVHGPASGTILGHQILNNVIAFNGELGIVMGSSGVGAGGSAARNRISQNSIHSNGRLGIDLLSGNQNIDSVSLNDACDVDTGISHPNEGQNFPVLSSATANGGDVTINGTLNSNAGGTFTIEFFANTVAESSLHGEGKTYLGSTTATDSDSDCNSAFSVTLPRPAGSGFFITATATDSLGNTSEFSRHVDEVPTFVVTNTGDGGLGSLREAISNAAVDSGADTIGFNIPPTDARHFYYQNNGIAGTVSRANIAQTAAADDTTIADIDPDWPHSWYSIETAGFTGDSLFSNPITIDGSWQPGSVPNTNQSGALNSVLKIEVRNSSTDSSCSRIFHAAFDAVVLRGMIINGCSQSSGARLIDFDFASHSSVAAGNYIGTDPSGTIPLGSGYGVHITQASGVTVGGSSPADRNLISANFRGIVINSGPSSGASVSGTLVAGNLIGTARDGVLPLGNGLHPEQPSQREDAISIQSIAGTALDHRVENNVIAFSARYGISLLGGGAGTGQTITGNRITGNSIHSSGNIGINLDGNDQGAFNAVTPNDPWDADAGANNLQNYPLLASASASGGNLNITGTLNSLAGGTYTIEFFANSAADPSGFGEGETYLGSILVSDSDGDCNSAFSTTFPRPAGSGTFITATATDAAGNTSEFSASVEAASSCAALTLGSTGSTNGAQHVPFSRTITASGGTGPYTYSLTGQLPAGLSLNASTGEISGTPTQFIPGTLYIFSITATDASGCAGEINIAMTIEAFSCALAGNAPTAISGDLVIDGTTATTINLACLVSVTGNLVVTNNNQAGVLDLSNLGTVGGNVNVSGNTAAGNLDLGSLVNVSGNLIIANNPSGNLDLSSLGTVSGDLDITNSHASGDLDLNLLGTVGGSVNIAQNTTSGDLDLGSLGTVGGMVNIAENATSGDLDISSLTSTGGTFRIASNGSAAVIGMSNLGTVAGSVDISGNGAASTVGLGSLINVADDVTIEDNGSASQVDLGALQTGDVISIGGNTAASTVDLGSLGTAGEVNITGNGAAEVTLDLTSVAGDVTIDSTGTGTFSIGDGSVGGTIDLDLSGYTSVSGATAGSATSVSNETAQAVMSVNLPDGAFTTPVGFSITNQDPATLPPAIGTLPNGTPGVIDPLTAYQFTFGVPTLNQDASLVFEILVDGLDQATRDVLLAAVASGSATLATRGDAPGSAFQAFAICAAGQDPAAGGCVRLELLDANGLPTIGTPAIIRFTGVVGHFSTWAVAVAFAPTAAPVSIAGRVTDPWGRGIRGAVVTLSDASGSVRSVTTNSFGRYKFDDLSPGETYVLSARAKRYRFDNPTRVISLTQDLTNENFQASDPARFPAPLWGNEAQHYKHRRAISSDESPQTRRKKAN